MGEIVLTDGQKKGLDLALRLAKAAQNGKPSVGTICGYAGTGKSTTLKFIIDELRSQGGAPVLLSPTGKAAARILEITGYGASTIHRWIYEPRQDEKTGYLKFIRKDINEINVPACRLVVCDEASMIGPEVWEDIRETCTSLGCSLLLIGDGFQLPPVMPRGETFSVMGSDFVPGGHWIHLKDVMRQAASNPIIRISMALREGDPYEAMADLDYVLPEELDEALLAADMRICRSNKVRHALNERCRQLMGLSGDANPGEPLLVLRNNYDLEVYNGETHEYQGHVQNLGTKEVYDGWTQETATIRIHLGRVADREILLIPEALTGALDGKIGPHVLEKACSYWTREKKYGFLHCNFGYVLTAHKSQGSEADRVLVCFEKGMNLSREEDRRWAYTSLTRAKKRVQVVNI